MSFISTRLSAGLSKIIQDGGTPIRVQYFTSTTGSIWDDDLALTQSGEDLWTSGIIFPLKTTPGHSDSLLVEQGKLLLSDSKLFLHGSLVLAGSEFTIKITVGSPSNVDNNYAIIPPGPARYSVSNVHIYKTAFIRRIGNNGSLFGE